jgi:hypothetical protein
MSASDAPRVVPFPEIPSERVGVQAHPFAGKPGIINLTGQRKTGARATHRGIDNTVNPFSPAARGRSETIGLNRYAAYRVPLAKSARSISVSTVPGYENTPKASDLSAQNWPSQRILGRCRRNHPQS